MDTIVMISELKSYKSEDIFYGLKIILGFFLLLLHGKKQKILDLRFLSKICIGTVRKGIRVIEARTPETQSTGQVPPKTE